MTRTTCVLKQTVEVAQIVAVQKDLFAIRLSVFFAAKHSLELILEIPCFHSAVSQKQRQTVSIGASSGENVAANDFGFSKVRRCGVEIDIVHVVCEEERRTKRPCGER